MKTFKTKQKTSFYLSDLQPTLEEFKQRFFGSVCKMNQLSNTSLTAACKCVYVIWFLY